MTDETSSKKRGGILARGWRNVREAGPIQLVATLLLVLVALFFARFSWTLPDGEEPTPLTNAAELALFDTAAPPGVAVITDFLG